ATPQSGQATVTVAVDLSRSLSATIVALTPHLQCQVATTVITVPQILRRGHNSSKHFPSTNVVPRLVVSGKGQNGAAGGPRPHDSAITMQSPHAPPNPPTGRVTLQGVKFGSRRVPRTIPKNAVHVPTFFTERDASLFAAGHICCKLSRLSKTYRETRRN